MSEPRPAAVEHGSRLKPFIARIAAGETLSEDRAAKNPYR